MQQLSDDIAFSKSSRFQSSLNPGSGLSNVIDVSCDSPALRHLEIPSHVTKELGNGAWKQFSRSSFHHASRDVSLFSTSLPVLPHENLKLNDIDQSGQSVDDISCSISKFDPDSEGNCPLENAKYHAIGTLLPDDEDELFSGKMDVFDISGLSNQVDDLEEYDVFGSGGGMEMESGLQESLSNGMSNVSLSDGGALNGIGTIPGEHPYGEHPSRTLFVRNINSNVEDSELKSLFEQYGDIRTLYTACKHRGFVMISYYDIRDARTAMRALQNKLLRRRKLDIHFSIPKDNPSDKDINQGTLVVFNLDPSVTNDDLRQIFGAYGEVKEIRETPHKRHHKFVEYFDVRAAEAALRSLNKSDIAGKRIKLEPSRPGGARRSFMGHLNQELELDESLNFRHQLGTSITNSPPGGWPYYSSAVEHSTLQMLGISSGFGSRSPTIGNKLPNLASAQHPRVINPARIVGSRRGHLEHKFTDLNFNHGSALQQSHSFPEARPNPISRPISTFSASTSKGPGVETLSGSQFLWGSSSSHIQLSKSFSWQIPSEGHPFTSNGQSLGLPYAARHGSLVDVSLHLPHLHVGSAPSGLPIERHFGFYKDSLERSFTTPVGFGGSTIGQNETTFSVNKGSRVTGNMLENGSPGYRMISSSGLSPVFLGNNAYYQGVGPIGVNGFEHSWNRRVENSGNQVVSKKQFQLDLEKIRSGEDTRTTLMIKNIPNKYTAKMLMAAIDEGYRGMYDFLYLPIDFKNKCNVGYAFINMSSPSHIIPFYKVFNGKRWEKFNSEKVASVAYARIQGKAALVAHFQNSSLMNEDKRCRPIVFQADGSEAGDQIIQEHLPSNALNIQVRQSYLEDFKGSPLQETLH